MAKDTIKVIQVDTNPAQKSFRELRKELMEYRNQMANLEEGSDAFLEIANKAGTLKHQIDEINESIKGASADFGDMVGNVTNVAAGLVGAFEAVSGGLQALGLQNEAIDETIVRMQGLMAVVQGLSAIDDGIKAMDKLRESITSTSAAAKVLKTVLTPKTFLIVAAAVTALTFVFSGLKKKQEEAAAAQEALNKKLAEEKQARDDVSRNKYLSSLDRELRIKQEIAGIRYGDDELAKLKAQIAIYDKELSKLSFETDFYLKGNKLNPDDDVALELKKRTDAMKKYLELRQELSDRVAIIEATEGERKKKQAAEAAAQAAKEKADREKADKEASEARKKSYEDEEATINYLIGLYKELNAGNDVEFEKEKLNLEQRRLQNIKSYFGETSEEYKEQLIIVRELEAAFAKLTEVKEETLTAEEIQLALENDRLKQLAEGWLYNEETAMQSFDRISEELKKALDRNLINEEQYDKAVKNLATQRTRYIVEQSTEVFTSTSDLLTTLLDGLADQQDTTNKEGFEKSKKLQIASATIQMLSGITAAIAGAFTSKTGIWDFILAGIQAATIATSGALQINKIKSTTYEGGGTATPSAGAVSSMIVPPVQFSQAVQGASTEGAIKSTKVYVTESDITNTINKVNVQETENTY